MLGLNVIFTTKGEQGDREALIAAFTQAGLLEAIRKEDGCVQYEFYYSAERENEIYLMEKWESQDKQTAHLSAPHMDEFRAVKGKYVIDTTIAKYEI